MATRSITSPMTAAAAARVQAPLLLVEALFTSGPLRLWNGLGDLAWNGETWNGSGSLLGLDAGAEVQAVVAAGARYTLTGVDAALIALALDENYQGRPVSMWLGMFDAGGAVVVDPVLLFSGRLDVMEIAEDGDSATISVSAESRLADLERAPGGVYTDEDQKARYPTDRGLEFIASQQDREIIWR